MKVTGNVKPEEVVRLGDKIYINIEPVEVVYTNEDNESIILYKYEQFVLPFTSSEDMIQETIRVNSSDYKLRERRNILLDDSDKKIARYNDEVLLNLPTTDSLIKLTSYRQYLRDITNEEGFPYIHIKTYEEFILWQKK